MNNVFRSGHYLFLEFLFNDMDQSLKFLYAILFIHSFHFLSFLYLEFTLFYFSYLLKYHTFKMRFFYTITFSPINLIKLCIYTILF